MMVVVHANEDRVPESENRSDSARLTASSGKRSAWRRPEGREGRRARKIKRRKIERSKRVNRGNSAGGRGSKVAGGFT